MESSLIQLLIQLESSLIQLESSFIQLQSSLIQLQCSPNAYGVLESSLIQLESSLIQLESSLIQLESSLINWVYANLAFHINRIDINYVYFYIEMYLCFYGDVLMPACESPMYEILSHTHDIIK